MRIRREDEEEMAGKSFRVHEVTWSGRALIERKRRGRRKE